MSALKREHHTDRPWPCSCDDCCRQAAGAWNGLMDRVFDGGISLSEANAIYDSASPVDVGAPDPKGKT